MAAAAALSAVMGLVGSVISAKAEKQRADSEAQMMEANAQAAERDANNKAAEGQRRALAVRKETEELTSRAQTVAAASGGGNIGTATKASAALAGKGAYNESVALYEGATQEQSLKSSAERERYAAQQKRKAGKTAMISGIIGGVSNFAGSFAGRGSLGGAGGSQMAHRYG